MNWRKAPLPSRFGPVTIVADGTAEMHFLGRAETYHYYMDPGGGAGAHTLSARLVSAQNHPTVTAA